MVELKVYEKIFYRMGEEVRNRCSSRCTKKKRI